MTTQEVANKLVELVRAGKYDQIHSELYSDAIISIENPAQPDGVMMKYDLQEGMEAKMNKSKEWNDNIEENIEDSVSEPLVSGNNFVIRWYSKVKFKDGNIVEMDELCIYSVKDGKIFKEEFIY